MIQQDLSAPPASLRGPGTDWSLDGRYFPSSGERDVPISILGLRLMTYLFHALWHVFEERQDVVVGADQFIYYDRNDRRKNIAPDAYVIPGVPKLPLRRSIRIWEEAPLAFVAEVSSEESRPGDRGWKLELYRDVLRVPVYLIYDDEWREMLFYRLYGGEYRLEEPDATGRYACPELGVSFGPDPEVAIRVYDGSGQPIPWDDELHRRLEALQDSHEEMRRLIESREEDLAAERERTRELAAEVERLRRALSGQEKPE